MELLEYQDFHSRVCILVMSVCRLLQQLTRQSLVSTAFIVEFLLGSVTTWVALLKNVRIATG